jgi:hypothetical protein
MKSRNELINLPSVRSTARINNTNNSLIDLMSGVSTTNQ